MGRSGAFSAGSAAIALIWAGFAVPAAAQDTFSLPPGTASPSARPAGPVDPDNPVVRPRPTQTATAQPVTPQPSPTASAPPTISVPPAAGTRPAPRATATPRSGATGPGSAAPQATGAPAGDPLALPETATPSATIDNLPTAIPTAPSTAPTAAITAGGSASLPDWWPYAAGGLAALLALLGAAAWWRKRQVPTVPTIEFEPPVVAPAPPRALPEPDFALPAESPVEPVATLAAEPDAAAVPPPVTEQRVDGLAITLEARRLDASLMAATLAYTLRITNTGAAPFTALGIEADMVAAHASLPVEQQIASAALRLERRHAVTELAPGESTDLRGEIRLPLSSITPIRTGNAAYFVPLARVRVEAGPDAGAPVVLAQTFVVGELPDQAGGALRPFRLDLGPRTYSRLGQRAVN